MVRISDIAGELGVSRSLVSKVLSGRMGKSSVRPELAERIHARAKKMGYVPNASAKALFTGRHNVVGVFISRYGQPGSGLEEAFIDGVSGEFIKTGQRMLLQFFHDEPDFDACLAVAHRSMVDGVIVAGAHYFDLEPKLTTIMERGVPVATMFCQPMMEEIPNAGIDQMKVGLLATRHLITRGCARPIFIKVSRAEEGVLRFDGYKAALAGAGLPYRPELVCALKTYETKALPEKIKALLESGAAFDGIVAESDRQTSVIFRELLAAGLRVPEDVKLIGVDNSPLCDFMPVKLSSVSGCDRRRAVLAVRMLNKLINGKTARDSTANPVVVARESTAARR